MRKICSKCSKRQVAINYRKDEKIFYRTVCDTCAKNRKTGVSLWEKSGYKKKNLCDKCSYSSIHTEQFDVFHVDGNLLNSRHSNLKTVCANCQRILTKELFKWKRGNIKPDL